MNGNRKTDEITGETSKSKHDLEELLTLWGFPSASATGEESPRSLLASLSKEELSVLVTLVTAVRLPLDATWVTITQRNISVQVKISPEPYSKSRRHGYPRMGWHITNHYKNLTGAARSEKQARDGLQFDTPLE